MRLIVEELERQLILKKYGLLKESDEFDLPSNHNPNNRTFIDRVNCDPFCEFDVQEVTIIKKCFSAEQYKRNVEFQPTAADKEEIVSMTLGTCVANGKMDKKNADYLTKKFKNIFYNTWSSYSEGASAKTPEEQKKKEYCNQIRNNIDKQKVDFSEFNNTYPCYEEILKKTKSKLEFVKTESEPFLEEAKKFFIDYFDYNKKPKILEKIFRIDMGKNPPPAKDINLETYKELKIEDIKDAIDGLKPNFLDKVELVLNYGYCLTNPNVMGFVRLRVAQTFEIYTLNICPTSILVDDKYNLDKNNFSNTILHELGHLVDGYFRGEGIDLIISDSGADPSTSTGVSIFPHTKQGMSGEFLPIESGDDEYMETDFENFTRYKVIYKMIQDNGYDFSIDTKTYFCQFFFKLLKEGIIYDYDDFGFPQLTLYEDFLSFKYYKDSVRFRNKSGERGNLEWIFMRLGKYKEIPKEEVKDDMRYEIIINLGKMYDEMQNDYVEVKTDKGELDNRA